MAKAPLYTVINNGKEPRSAAFGGRAEPIDAGFDKSLPLTADEAVALASQGFTVRDPQGDRVTGKKASAESKPAA